jgi:hypothetical protein
LANIEHMGVVILTITLSRHVTFRIAIELIFGVVRHVATARFDVRDMYNGSRPCQQQQVGRFSAAAAALVASPVWLTTRLWV